MPTPLLIISDAPTSGTGLGRITKDLATRIHANLPEFRVGTLGYGGPFSRALGFPQYNMDMHDWVIFNLPEVWKDFAGDEKGIVFTVWDASRLLWFSRPENCENQRLRKFLTNPPFERWGYFPIDATGPHDKLTHILVHTMQGYDRVLAYSAWAAEIVDRSYGRVFCEHRPHGIDTSVWYPRNRAAARHGFGERIGARNRKGKWWNIPDDALLIGVVATNQIRKDWGLSIQTVAEIAKERKVALWCHTDVLERHWSLPALLNDFGLVESTVVTAIELTDEQMAWNYSACDLTLGIGNAEGFGLPIFESLACGTPCVHCNDGGAAEHLPESMKVDPIYWKLEGCYNCRRGIYRVEDWVERSLGLHGAKSAQSLLPPHLAWDTLWPRWAEWFLKGLPCHDQTTATAGLLST